MLPFEFINLEGASYDLANESAEIEAFLRWPFDLELQPPMRVRLVCYKKDHHMLQIVMHHIASDGKSKVVLLEELSEYYNAIITGHKTEARNQRTSFASLAITEREWLKGDEATAMLRYWRDQPFAKGLDHPWPVDRESATWADEMSVADERIVFEIEKELSEKIYASASEHGMTAFQLMMSCYFLCMQRLMPGNDITMVVPVDIRRSEKESSLVGCLMNMVPITMGAQVPDTLDEYLKMAGDRIRNAVEYARLPLYKILEENSAKSRSEGPLTWTTIVNFKEDYADALSLNGTKIDVLPFKHAEATGGLKITYHGSKNRSKLDAIKLIAEPDISKLSKRDTLVLLQTWREVMRQCVGYNPVSLADIDILLPGERERILEISGRNNIVQYPATTLHDIFRQTAEQYPDRPAVIEANGNVTNYKILQTQVVQIAAFLRNKGIGRDVVVAVFMKRSPQLLVSMLGILETGCAFLLMETSVPVDRLQKMAEQARASMILTGEDMTAIPGFAERTYLFRDIMASDNSCETNDQYKSDRSNLAYIMFTSGSTGIPKGTMVEHRNLVNYLLFNKKFFSLGIEDRTLQQTALSFDVCIPELLLPMVTGCAVVFPDPNAEADLEYIRDLILKHHISILSFTPAVLKLLLEVPGIEKLKKIVRIIDSGGEALSYTLMNECLTKLGSSLYNGYGPAETADAVSIWRCHTGYGQTNPPIGMPMANIVLLLMDDHGRPVPPGMPGELWIGGAQTGRGYINNEEETRKRFVHDPMEPGSGRRFYRSGDIARFLPDGNILFLGRMDDQLKVRGVRIEPGDIGAALMRCEGINEAVVLAEPDEDGSNRLRAWVTCKDNFQAKEAAIRSSLSRLLPSYMIPFRIHIIDHIPLTPNGKTDHRALRAYASENTDEAEGLPLTTPTQHSLAALWTELLGVPVQNCDADFFRLGGHSLSLLRMQAKIRKKWSIEFDLRRFYGNGTLSEMALQIEATIAGSEKPKFTLEITPLPIGKQGSGPNIYVMIGGDGSMPGFTKYINMSDSLGNRYNFFAMPYPEAIAGKMPSIPLTTLADRYAVAIRDHQPKGSYILMGECIGGFDAFATATALEKMTLDPIYLLMLDSIGKDFNKPILKKEGKRDKIFLHFMKDKIGDALRSLRILIGLNDKKDHLFTDFKVNAIRHRLFDPYWYSEQHPDVDSSGFDPFVQYMNTGWREHRTPASHFDTRICKEIFPTYDPENENPIARFLQEMKGNPHLQRVAKKLPTLTDVLTDVMAKYPLFDKEWYLRNNPDVAAFDIDPFQHYMQNGYKEHRHPSPIFYPLLYQYLCPDYNAKYQNPILHFALSGIDHPAVESAVLGLKIHENKNILIEQGWFNTKWYQHTYPGVLHYGYDPLAHYVSIGWRLGRKPYPGFQEQALAKSSPGYVVGKSNPLALLSSPETAALYIKHLDGKHTPMMPEEQASPEIQIPFKNETDNEMVSLTNSEQLNIIKVRSNIRRNQYKPDHFHGKTFILSSLLNHAVNPLLGWGSHLHGEVQTCLASGDHLSYIWEELGINTKKIEEYMNAMTSDTASTASSPS